METRLSASPTVNMDRRVARKVALRILPLSFFLFCTAYLDRVNLGYAALQMNSAIGLSSQAFGLAAGVLFIGSALFELPSSTLVLRFGPKRWIARIIVTWGIVASLTAFVQAPWQLYALRFALGVAEAGFIPAMVYYLSLWFRESERGFATGLFLTAIPVTYLVGAPVSIGLLKSLHAFGIEGWRWMLFLEGLPAIFSGVLCYFLFDDAPEDARWLNEQERTHLIRRIREERESLPAARHLSAWKALANPMVLYLSFIYFLSQAGAFGIGYWLPQILKSLSAGFSLGQIGWLSAAPYLAAMVGLVVWGRLSDRFSERKWMAAAPLLLAAAGLYVAGQTDDPALKIAALTVAVVGLFTNKPPLFSLMPQLFAPATVGVAVAVISSLGNCGGLAGPYLIGLTHRWTGSSALGLSLLSVALAVGALLTAMINTAAPKTALQGDSG